MINFVGKEDLSALMSFTEEDLLSEEKCLVFDPAEDEFKVEEPCVNSIGICKRRIVVAYESIADHVTHKMTSSKMPENLPEFSGPGSIPFYLLEDFSHFLQIQLSHQTLINGLQFSMTDNQAIKEFTLLVREKGIQKPDDYSIWGTYRLHFGDLPTDSSPQIITRKVMFQPIMADVLRIEIKEGDSVIQGALEILGMPNKKVYHADPIFEPILLETEYYVGHRSWFYQQVQQRGVCPHGGVTASFLYPHRQLGTSSYQSKIL